MRQRTKRQLEIAVRIGLVLIAIPVVGALVSRVPDVFRRLMPSPPHSWALELETELVEQGESLLHYGYVSSSVGSQRGQRFCKELEAEQGKAVQMVGYMTPLDQFDELERFVLLPRSVQCLKCEPPPQRDMVLVELREPTGLVNEPVLVRGRLELIREPNAPFWYRITEADWRAPLEGEELAERVVPEEHRHAPSKIMEALGKMGTVTY